MNSKHLIAMLLIVYGSMAAALFWKTQQINALTNLHDEDVKALIEMDQFYQKKLKPKKPRKTKQCQVIYVA
jgi:hypothetical protein